MLKQEPGQRLFGEHFHTALSADERAFMEKLRELCRTTIAPRAEKVGSRDEFAWDNFRTLAKEGVIATAFPREHGGTGARVGLRVRIIEEVARVCSASASMITGTDISTRTIIAGASESLKRDLLPRLCTGEIQSAFALTEPAAGSDVRGIQTTMRKTGDAYVVNGEKKFITRADTADWFVVYGKLEEQPAALVALLVPRDSPGFTVSPVVGKLGWYGVPICSLKFKDVKVPQAYRLGREGEGFELAQDALVRARIGHAAMAIGRAMGAVEIAAAYAVDRNMFGKALGDHQGIQWMLADMFTQIEAARALIAVAADKYDRHEADVQVYASMAKQHATDLGMRVVTDSLQITGGRGYLQDFPLERFFRDAKINQIGEGSSEVHKTVIGRDLVRRARNSERNPCLKHGSLVDY